MRPGPHQWGGSSHPREWLCSQEKPPSCLPGHRAGPSLAPPLCAAAQRRPPPPPTPGLCDPPAQRGPSEGRPRLLFADGTTHNPEIHSYYRDRAELKAGELRGLREADVHRAHPHRDGWLSFQNLPLPISSTESREGKASLGYCPARNRVEAMPGPGARQVSRGDPCPGQPGRLWSPGRVASRALRRGGRDMELWNLPADFRPGLGAAL